MDKTNKKRQHSSKTSTPGSEKVVKKQLKPDASIMAAHTTKSMAELTLRKRAYKTLELEDKEVGTFQFFNSQSVFGPDMLQKLTAGAFSTDEAPVPLGVESLVAGAETFTSQSSGFCGIYAKLPQAQAWDFILY